MARPTSMKLPLIVASLVATGCVVSPGDEASSKPVSTAGSGGAAGAVDAPAEPTSVKGQLASELDPEATVVAVRAVAPLSGARAGTRPVFRWSRSNGVTGARLQVCADRACVVVERTLDVDGDSAQLPSALSTGIHYWRLFARSAAGRVAPGATAPWEIAVHARATKLSSGAIADFDGDGHGDAAFTAVAGGARVLGYAGSALGLATTPTWSSAVPLPTHGELGAIANVGDTNGDGYADLLVAVEADSDADARALVYPGSAIGLAAKPSVILESPTTDLGAFAFNVERAGDVNGDGYGDAIVKHAMVRVGGGTAVDRLYVYEGSASGLATKPAAVLAGGAGASLLDAAPAGDVNGDGYADLLVHDQRYLNGLVEVILGSASGPVLTPAIVLQSPDVNYAPTFGATILRAGDLNADGFDDVVVYAERAPTAASSKAPFELFVYPGSASGLASAPSAVTAPPSDVTDGQATIAAAGDVDGDGHDDVLVGIFGASTLASEWPVAIYRGTSRGLSAQPSQRLANPGLTPLTGGKFGAWSLGLGDVNGDAIDDLLVGPYDRLVYSPTSLIGIAFLDRTMFAHLGTALGVATASVSALWSADGSFGASIAGSR